MFSNSFLIFIITAPPLTYRTFSIHSQELKSAKYDVLNVSDNELAKAHARHMVGGRAKVDDERLFRFEFPETPGALQKFLDKLPSNINISLFHYRNYGHDIGRVLVGMQVPSSDSKAFTKSLDDLGYIYFEETNNEVYKQFLHH